MGCILLAVELPLPFPLPLPNLGLGNGDLTFASFSLSDDIVSPPLDEEALPPTPDPEPAPAPEPLARPRPHEPRPLPDPRAAGVVESVGEEGLADAVADVVVEVAAVETLPRPLPFPLSLSLSVAGADADETGLVPAVVVVGVEVDVDVEGGASEVLYGRNNKKATSQWSSLL